MAHVLRTAAALFLGSLAAVVELVALLLLIAVGATAVASFSYLWYGGDFGTVSACALTLAGLASLCYLSAHALRRARYAIESSELQVRGFEVQPIVPKAVRLLVRGSAAAASERNE